MAEHITHQEYVASIRWRVVETAKLMLAGEMPFLDGSLTLDGLLPEAGIEHDDRDYRPFNLIASETDHLPPRHARQHWSADVLKKLQPEFDKSEVWARDIGAAACESLIRRFEV